MKRKRIGTLLANGKRRRKSPRGNHWFQTVKDELKQ